MSSFPPGDRQPDYEDEIDLREYVSTILRYRWLVAGLAVVAAVVALVLSMLPPRAYEATAVVAITKSPYVMDFDPKLRTAADVAPPSKALISLATTDELLATLLSSQPGSLPSTVQSVDDLRSLLTAAATPDPSLVTLKVRLQDPGQAAAFANAWADALVVRARELYGRTEGDVAYFVERLGEADGRLAKAETSLAEFQGHNELGLLRAQLSSLEAEQQSYLSDRESVVRLIRDVEVYRAQLAKAPQDVVVSPGDDLIALLLTARTHSAGATSQPQPQVAGLESSSGSARPDATSGSGQSATTLVQLQVVGSGASAPVQFQVSPGDIRSGRTAGELQTLLGDLATSSKTKADAVEARLTELGPQILALQASLQRAQNEVDRLTLERKVAQETYQTLARKVDEARIAAQDADGQIQLVSRAHLPSRPTSTNAFRNTVGAGALGLFMGMVGALVYEWWRGGPRVAAGEEPSQAMAADRLAGSSV